MILASLGTGSLLWGLLSFFFMIIYFMIMFNIIIDLFRDPELAGGAKAVWFLFIIIFPVVSMLVYLVTRSEGMARRSFARAQQHETQLQDYVRHIAGTSPADQIIQAKALLDQGTITQQEFDKLKARALA